MLDRLRELRDRLGDHDPVEDNETTSEFKALRMLTAELLMLTSVDAALDAFGRATREPGPPYPHGSPGPARTPLARAAAWVPAMLAPLAAAAHLTHALRPSAPSAQATRALNAAAIGAGVAGIVESFLASRRTHTAPSITPLALVSAGVLGLILEREEHQAREARERLERRASLVERFTPQRRRRLERIVLHV